MNVGRPREFDRSEALQCAVDAFWTRGFECTQIEDLIDAMGIGRGSMYAAFGDKRTLYLEALELFVVRVQGFFRKRLLEGPGTPLQNLRAFVGMWPKFVEDGRGRGCFITNALTEKAASDADVARITSRALRAEELLLHGILSEARASGELRADADPAALARAIVNARLGVTLQARLGAPAENAKAAADAMLALL